MVDILTILFGFSDKFKHAKNTSLYSKESRKSLTFYQGINSWGDVRHGYKGPDTPRNTGIHYCIFTLYALDKTLGMDTTNTANWEVLGAMEGVNILESKNIIGT